MKRILVVLLSFLLLLNCFSCSKNSEENENESSNQQDIEEKQQDFDYISQLTDLERWGLDPGLGVSVLHKLGYTGKGVNVAYCDQPLTQPTHKELENSLVYYANISDFIGQMHGNATSTLIAGANMGTAPEANLYYFDYISWVDNQQKNWITCLDELIKINKGLPEGQKIRIVGFSNNPRPSEPYYKELMQAIERCHDNDIMVLWCGENLGCSFEDFSDKSNINNINNYLGVKDSDYLTCVPGGTRTSLSNEANYEFWDKDNIGLSWTMPYTVGIYAIAQSIDYDITEQEIKELVSETNAINKDGYRIFQPVEFIARVLEKVGRTEDADELRQEYINSFKYTYIIYNSNKLNNDDIKSIEKYASKIINSYPILLDCANYNSSKEIYNALKKSHEEKGGTIVGVQIMGDSSVVAPFEITYEVDMVNEIDKAGTFFTDFFYQNLDNDIDLLNKEFSVYKNENENLNIDYTPNWPLARLPLANGEFTKYFNKYYDFIKKTSQDEIQLVNFSSPIFASEEHSDDFGVFLNRLKDEYQVIDDFTLYGNTLGQYPVKTEITGSFTQDNLKAVNQEGIVEYIINGHGQKDNVDICYFENDNEKRMSVLNKSNINSVLNGNYYYLDMWTCNNAEKMKDNLTTEALKGNCIGMFSTSHIISNNGVNNKATVEDMKKANFYYFYFNYLRTLYKGYSRDLSFYKAQYKYSKALVEFGKEGVIHYANYQFNLNNLLAYENYGVLTNDCLDYLQLNDEFSINEELSNYQPGISFNNLYVDLSNFQGEFELLSESCELTEDGYYKITMEFNTSGSYEIFVFNPPNGDVFLESICYSKEGYNKIEFNIEKSIWESVDEVVFSMVINDNDRLFIKIK